MANSAWATPYCTITQDLDMGSVLIPNPAGSCTYTISDAGAVTSHSSGLTIREQHNGSLTVYNDSSSSLSIYTGFTPGSGSSTRLTCTADCQGGAASCSVTFKGTRSEDRSNYSGNASKNLVLGGRVDIPANCGTGLFTGVITVRVRNKNKNGTLYDTKTMPILLRIVSDFSAFTVTNAQNMNLGTLSVNSAHNVTLNPQTCTISSTVPSGILISNTARCGIINVANSNQTPSSVTSIQLPSSITLSGSVSGTMTLDITSYPEVSSITSVASGTTPIYIGGTLHVLGTEVPGTYSGNYTLTVNY